MSNPARSVKYLAMIIAVSMSLIATAGNCTGPGQELSGTVVSDDSPVEGAAVYVYVPDFTNPMKMECTRIATSDQDGAFRYSLDQHETYNRYNGVYWVIAHRDGYAVGWKVIMPDDDIRDIGITLGQPSAITGKVTAKDGKGIPGAQVAVMAVGASVMRLYMQGAIPELATATDRNGAFTIEGLPENMPASLLVTASGFVTAWYNANNRNVEEQAYELRPDGRISGVVTYAGSDDPVPNAHVLARIMDDNEFSVGTATTDKYGQYEIAGLSPGMHQVTASVATPYEKPGWADVTIENIKVEEGKTSANADIELVRGCRVTGKISDEETGAPIPRVLVSARPAEKYTQICYGMNFTDGDGVYVLRTVPGDVSINIISWPPVYQRQPESKRVTVDDESVIINNIDFQLR